MSEAKERLKKRVALLRGVTSSSRGRVKSPNSDSSEAKTATKKGQSTNPKNKRP